MKEWRAGIDGRGCSPFTSQSEGREKFKKRSKRRVQEERMGAGRKTQTFTLGDTAPFASATPNSSVSARNLRKENLGGVIFGCRHSTMRECLSKQIFGLPASHFSYVRNIEQGLPLFLFNYSDRKLHGIFEAAGPGQMNINPYGWTEDGSERTLYPAQVRIHIRMQCQALQENHFSQIIIDNYYTPVHFWFELDHTQTNALIASFSSTPVDTIAIPHNIPKSRSLSRALPSHDTRNGASDHISSVLEEGWGPWGQLNQSNMDVGSLDGDTSQPLGACPDTETMDEDEEQVYLRLKQISLDRQQSHSSSVVYTEDIAHPSVSTDGNPSIATVMHLEDKSQVEPLVSAENGVEISVDSSHFGLVVAQLMKGIEELKTFSVEQHQKTSALEKKLVESEIHIQQLNDRVKELELKLVPSISCFDGRSKASCDDEPLVEAVDELYSCQDELVLIVGGYDGTSWLSDVDSYSPSMDIMRSLKPMSSVRSYGAAAMLNDHLYVFGGGNGNLWYDTVERYNPTSNEWTSCPPLIERKGSLAGVALDNKIYAIGGGDGVESFWGVEMFDPALERWIPARSMLQKRFAPAAVELNGGIYAVGGFDGKDYLKSAERFDPREVSWIRLPSMNTRRGCHSLAVLNEKIYALGGYDGTQMVPSVEIFDPRMDSWMTGDPMNQPRGYSAAAVIGNSIYAIGGLKSSENILDTVECYNPGKGWQVTNSKGIGKRCFFSAVVLEGSGGVIDPIPLKRED